MIELAIKTYFIIDFPHYVYTKFLDKVTPAQSKSQFYFTVAEEVEGQSLIPGELILIIKLTLI